MATEDSLRVELTKAQAAQAQINKELIEERTTVIRLQAQDRDLYRAEVERMLRILCS